MAIDYKHILIQAFKEFADILTQRQESDLKLAQKEQFIRATMYQLPDNDRAIFEELLDKLLTGPTGLSASIRGILNANPRKWYTAAQVRDALIKSGFDFANYASNPLASIHSALKRLKAEEAEMTTNDGVMVWRWKSAHVMPRARRRVPFAASGLYPGVTAPITGTSFWKDIVNNALAKDKE
jgi:hypothetical protein